MKAACLHDLSINIATAPESLSKPAVPVFEGEEVVAWIVPKGTVLEGEQALIRVSHGQAEPVDEECAKACGLSSEQLSRAQRTNLGAERGIRGKKDHDLFMAGVIDGYAPGSTDEKPIYLPGKQWDRYQAALKAKKEADDE